MRIGMRWNAILLLCLVCVACMPATITRPPVSVDERMLEILPEGAGWSILDEQSRSTERLYAELRAQGEVADSNQICKFDLARQAVMVKGTPRDASAMGLIAYTVDRQGQFARDAARKGLPIVSTNVMLLPGGDDWGNVCVLAILSGERVDADVARLFSAAKQVGVGLSCRNITCD